MSERKEITKNLTETLKVFLNPHNDTRIYTASEVTFDYAMAHPIRVDYMMFKPENNTAGGIEKGNFYCYEIKSCKEDFQSGHGLNFIGDYNYLVMPLEVYEECKSLIPYKVGVYVPNDNIFYPLRCVKKAKNKTRTRTTTEMLLMMFRSANRELIKKELKEGENNG